MPEVGSMEAGGERDPIQLQPFIHQVGGHSSMLRYDDTTVCKPSITREQSFYQNIPFQLMEFTPEFRGVIDVELHEDHEGYITLVGYPDSSKSSKCTSASSVSCESDPEGPYQNTQPSQSQSATDTYSIRLLRSGSLEVKAQNSETFDSEDSSHSQTGNINPWSLKCHKRQLSKMRKTLNQDGQTSKFILLENVAAKFRYPCILDLKMGTRVHGDEVPEAKKERHMMKCTNTTSSTLGIRMSGMQVYQPSTGTYKCQNKYYGRKLSAEGFKQTLVEFLNNGCEIRKELTAPIVKRLKHLVEQICQQDTFRFYSSSLLIMYDGQVPAKSFQESDSQQAHSRCDVESQLQDNLQVDVRMIDFAHSTYSGFQNDKTIHKGPDEGYLFGLRNLIQFFSDIR